MLNSVPHTDIARSRPLAILTSQSRQDVYGYQSVYNHIQMMKEPIRLKTNVIFWISGFTAPNTPGYGKTGESGHSPIT